MIKITEEKTITGQIIDVSQPKIRGTSWGKVLFTAYELLVKVKCAKKQKMFHMYIRADSALGISGVTPHIINKKWNITLHGEFTNINRGVFIIDNLNPCSNKIKEYKLDDFFE